MRSVVVGAEHGIKPTAGSIAHFTQECLFRLYAIPLARDGDFSAIEKDERGEVDCVCGRVLAPPASRGVVHISAVVGAKVAYPSDFHPEVLPRRRLQGVPFE